MLEISYIKFDLYGLNLSNKFIEPWIMINDRLEPEEIDNVTLWIMMSVFYNNPMYIDSYIPTISYDRDDYNYLYGLFKDIIDCIIECFPFLISPTILKECNPIKAWFDVNPSMNSVELSVIMEEIESEEKWYDRACLRYIKYRY